MLIKNRLANSEDPDETDHYEPSYLDLHCLQKYLSWSLGLKEFIIDAKKIPQQPIHADDPTFTHFCIHFFFALTFFKTQAASVKCYMHVYSSEALSKSSYKIVEK